MLFLPVSPDAKVRHPPFLTAALIVVNVGVWLGVWSLGLMGEARQWMLSYGALDPAQWMLSVFIHPNPWVLAANMVILWVLGLFVEGKLGPAGFFACYLLFTLAEAVLRQSLHLYFGGSQTGPIGAGTAAYGLMAMVLVWAPRNNLHCFYWLFLGGWVDVQVGVFCALFVAVDLALTALGLTPRGRPQRGAALGFPLAVLLLKRRVVECQGDDMFTLWRDGPRQRLTQEEKDLRFLEKRREQEKTRTFEIIDSSHAQIKHYLKEGNALAAHKLLVKLKEAGGQDVPLQAEELAPLIKMLQDEKRWRESAPYMAQLIKVLGDAPQADKVRLKLAQVCVTEMARPARATELLSQIELKKLGPAQLKLIKQIAARAQELEAQADLELDDDAW